MCSEQPFADCAGFRLQPFAADSLTAGLELTVSAVRRSSSLLLRYELRGRLEDVLLPEPEQAATPSRRHQLWQQTCFELFIAPAGQPQYWEINLAPSGDWNVYAFSACREGMREEQAVTALPCQTERQPDALTLEFAVPAIIAAARPAEAAACAVIQRRTGQKSFWALRHCGQQPDFHRRASFCLSLR
ncbi:DOMON-like domain-containing protein [Candidatus Electronema sp. TJ]|uniref:DOMON-like domain-containing protein n=1 Tax=Candidatus Electronema sp. TJ TaxID=3401573 RepID=UPI003AA812D4